MGSHNPQLSTMKTRAVVLPFRNPLRQPSGVTAWIDRGIFGAICVLAAITLQNPFAARWVFYAAVVLWVLKWIRSRKIFHPQPLIVPLLGFLVLLGVATSLSYAPLLSWLRMQWFTLLLLAVLLAQNINSMRQVRIVVVLLLAGAALSTALTAWQYGHGIGTELPFVQRGSILFRDGLRSGDLIQMMNGHRTRSLADWRSALAAVGNDAQLKLHIARGAPIEYYDLAIPRQDLEQWLSTPGMAVKRGHPLRAQGGLYHYVPYAGELLILGSLTFGLMIVPGVPRSIRVILLLLFFAIAAALLATVTRTFLAALLLGCGTMFWMAQRRLRVLALIGVLIAAAAVGIWIHKERGYGWLAPRDAGTEYREQMWKDSLHIIPHHLLFGVGPDSVLQFGDEWNVLAYKKFPLRSHFHSTYIQLAVDCGLPCLATWCWLMAAYVMFLWRSWQSLGGKDWFARGLMLGIFGGTIGFLLASFVHYTLGDGEVMMLVWLSMGLAMAAARLNREPAADQPWQSEYRF